MLFGAAMVIALMSDGCHDRGLSVRPAMSCNAGTFAQPRTGAVRCHQESGHHRGAIAEPHIHVQWAGNEIDHGRYHEIDANRRRLMGERCDQPPILDHMSERFTRFDLTPECQECRPHGVIDPAVGDHHIKDGLGIVRDRGPHPERIEHAARSRGNGRSPCILAGSGEIRIRQCYGKIAAQRLAQRDRERKPGESAACDQDVRTTGWEC